MPADVQRLIPWEEIEAGMPDLLPVSGGYSQAQRGLITVAGRGTVFVKRGQDDASKAWARREIAVYGCLAAHSFHPVPAVLSTNGDGTAFALEALRQTDGWDWSGRWTNDRLGATLRAIDDLAALEPTGSDSALLGERSLSEADDGWKVLAESAALQAALESKLDSTGWRVPIEITDIDQRRPETPSSSSPTTWSCTTMCEPITAPGTPAPAK
jgi:hypothetical protein